MGFSTVAEHIPYKFHEKLVKLLVKATGKFLVFGAARYYAIYYLHMSLYYNDLSHPCLHLNSKGQGGTGHLDESSFSREEWQRIFEDAGLEHVPMASEAAREAALAERQYDFFANLIVMKRPGVEVPAAMLQKYDDFMGNSADAYAHYFPIKSNFEDTVERGLKVEGQLEALWPELDLIHKKIGRNLIDCQGRKLPPYTQNPDEYEGWIREKFDMDSK